MRDQELLDTALDLFLDNGFEATTIETISAMVGMSRRTIYSRYEDKEALFLAALERAFDEWVVPPEELRSLETEDLRATLMSLGNAWSEQMLSKAGMRLLRATNTEIHRRPDMARYLWENTAAPTIAFLTDLFERRLRPGRKTPDAGDAALAFMTLVTEGAIQTALRMGTSMDEFQHLIEYRVDLFLHGALQFPLGEDA